jgi:hypothetical protein
VEQLRGLAAGSDDHDRHGDGERDAEKAGGSFIYCPYPGPGG